MWVAMQPPISTQIASLRLPGLVPRDLAAADADAESPVDVRSLPPSTPLTPDAGSRAKLELPPMHTSLPPHAPREVRSMSQLSQNEIKKAQNRKSAKRFREAQKKRWQSLQDEVLAQQRLIEELRAEIKERDAHPAKRSAMSINALVEGASAGATGSPPTAAMERADAEADLYAQLLSSAAPSEGHSRPSRPYVAELGTLDRCLVVSSEGRVLGTRRGSAAQIGSSVVQGVSEADAVAVRNALMCGSAVAVGYVRHGARFNAVVKPIPNSKDLLLAEFVPFSRSH